MKIGDKVTKRGSQGSGEIVDLKDTWVSVKWDEGGDRKAKICHLRELEAA